jgi:FixJ family two-component response regulator
LSNPPLIAIVDDDYAVREALLDLLQVEGLSARTFASGAALLADEAADTFDCIITDVRMPEINGLELQQRLRARCWAMPMIFITSSVDEATRARALLGGAAAWFTKPVADGELLDALRAALDRGNGALSQELPGG